MLFIFFISHSYSVLSFIVLLLSQSSGMNVLGKLLFLVLPFPRPRSPPFILMALYWECYCPSGRCACFPALFFPLLLLEQYFPCWIMLLLRLKVLKNCYALHPIMCGPLCTILNPFSIVHRSIRSHPAYASRVVFIATWDGWEDTTQFSLLWFR